MKCILTNKYNLYTSLLLTKSEMGGGKSIVLIVL